MQIHFKTEKQCAGVILEKSHFNVYTRIYIYMYIFLARALHDFLNEISKILLRIFFSEIIFRFLLKIANNATNSLFRLYTVIT